MKHGDFDSDAAALAQRIQSHEKFGTNDLNEWIFSALDPQDGQSVLDLGCGTGKQSIPMAQRVGKDGCVVSVDISEDAIKTVREKADQSGLQDRIEPHVLTLDRIGEIASPAEFDKIVASYSIYYVEDSNRLFETLSGALKPGGRLFFCGPSSENNAEIIKFHNEIKGESTGTAGSADLFMEGEGPALADKWFDSVETCTFENPLDFDSAEALVSYWSSYNLYEYDLADAFAKAAQDHFITHDVFRTTKRVIGVAANKAR